MEYGLVLLWLVVYLALLLAGVPLAATLFPRLADRGLGVALPLSAAVLWVVGYWVGHVSLSLSVWAGLLVLLTLVTALGYLQDVEFDWRLLAETAGVFTVAFCFLVAVRAVDPAVHSLGGEKFLDFGLLKSLMRAEVLPPEDMWFAGEPVRYYYGGHLLASLLTRLTGTDPRFAYNLALAGFYGMLVTAAYGLAGSIAAHRGSPRRLGGVLGAFLVGFASNLSTPAAFVVSVLPGGLGGFVAGLLSMPMEGLAVSLDAFSYWNASRIIGGTINEFPLFAWLNGDLHAHMMSTPFLLLVAALLFSYYRTPAAETTRRRFLVLGTLPPLAGLLAVVNTWSFPSVGGLTLLTLFLAPTDPRTLLPARLATRLQRPDSWVSDELSRLVTSGAFGAVVVVLGVVLSGPFWLGTASGRSIGLFPTRSPLVPLLLVHGGFLLVFVLYLFRQAVPQVRDSARVGVMLLLVVALGIVSKAPAVALFAPLVGVGWALSRFVDGSNESDSPSVSTAVSADGGDESEPATETAEEEPVQETDRTDDTLADTGSESSGFPARPGFETVLLVAGAGLLLLVEFVYVEEQAGPGRMNTVFKTYMQIWVLWGVAAGVALTDLVWQHRPSLGLSGGRWKPAFRVFAALLVASTSIYGGLALTDHFGDDRAITQTDDPTLDATRFVDVAHANEAPAIRWLDEQEGRPTIVSAPGGYRWSAVNGDGASAAASLTGIPTVIGWHHEIGYRGQEAYLNRTADVRAIYGGTPEQQRALLDAYDVRYIYVGPAERLTYGRITVDSLESVTVAKQWEDVTIYRVEQDALSTAE